MKVKNPTAELLSIIWEAVDLLKNQGLDEDAKCITKQTIKVCKEIERQSFTHLGLLELEIKN